MKKTNASDMIWKKKNLVRNNNQKLTRIIEYNVHCQTDKKWSRENAKRVLNQIIKRFIVKQIAGELGAMLPRSPGAMMRK